MGGPARSVVTAGTTDELVAAVRAADAAGERVLLVGGGSNLLVADDGFPGTVVLVRSRGVTVAVENLSASESRIRDTDMAQEMMNFTRSQILSQAGTAMLAQANQVPQGVLRLLG